ncbi:ABC transporter ATP-binding protein [soil metagenome]
MMILDAAGTKTTMSAAIRLDAISKTYGRGRGAVTALDSVSLEFPERSFTAVMGPSGSGKSTLIQCAAGLDKPSQGSVWLGETELSKLKEPQLTKARRKEIGFVFQAFNLLPSLTAKQNIQLPLKLAGESVDRHWFEEVVGSIGLDQLLNRYPAELSGGQQQRVAIARALVSRPRVVFADEPTGALDTKTSRQILELLRATVDQFGQTIIMVTHDPTAASFADRVLFLADGRIVDEMLQPTVASISLRMTQLEA